MKSILVLTLVFASTSLAGCQENQAAAESNASARDAAHKTPKDAHARKLETKPPVDYSVIPNNELKAMADNRDPGAQLTYAKRFADGMEKLRQDKTINEEERNAKIYEVQAEAETVAKLAMVSNPNPDAVRTFGRLNAAIMGRAEPMVAALQVASELGDISAHGELAGYRSENIDSVTVEIIERRIWRLVNRGRAQSSSK